MKIERFHKKDIGLYILMAEAIACIIGAAIVIANKIYYPMIALFAFYFVADTAIIYLVNTRNKNKTSKRIADWLFEKNKYKRN